MTIVTEQPRTLDPQQVRDVMSKLPTGVTVIAGEPELTGERAAMIVGSFVFISVEPCLVGFFVGKGSSSWPKLNEATVLGISTLSASQAQFCRKLGKKEADRFAEHFWNQGPCGAPLVAGSVAAMECQIENVTSVGDHDSFWPESSISAPEALLTLLSSKITSSPGSFAIDPTGLEPPDPAHTLLTDTLPRGLVEVAV